MKKIIPVSAFLLAGIFLLVGFSIKKTSVYNIPDIRTEAVYCAPPLLAPTPISDAVFRAKYLPSVVMVRKNVYSLSAAEISSIKTGITNMKALPYTNPTSWLYQAAIHGTTLPDNLPSWNTCHQAGQSFFFLAWHRMYVYFFERILRAKSGNPNLTLPYWNYQSNPVLQADYRANTPGNPLYDGTRSATINSGGSLPASIMTAFANSLTFIPYYDFQTNINGPHGSVHTTIGGNMFSVSTAAKDPVFWLHHCNIDRLWEEWLRKCNGRANPTDAAWLNKTYTFFDENGTAVSMSGSQVVKTASQLNYKYDFPLIYPCLIKLPKWLLVDKYWLLKKASPLVLDGQVQKADFVREQPEQLKAFITKNNKPRFDFTNKTAPEKLMLSLEGIKVDKMPDGVVEVYLNLPAGIAPSSDSRYFVGLLDLFSAEHHTKHNMQGMEDENVAELDVSKVAQALGLTVADLQKAEVTLYVRGNSLNGREVKTDAKVNIKQIQFSIYRYKN